MRELPAAAGGPGSRAGHTVACHFPLVEPAAAGGPGSRAAAGGPGSRVGQNSAARTTLRSDEKIEETPR